MAKTELLRTEYRALSGLLKLRVKGNPKKHDEDLIRASIIEHGFVVPLTVDDAHSLIGAGHGRVIVTSKMRDAGEPPPRYIDVRKDDWYIPVTAGVRFPSVQALRRFVLVDNQAVIKGGYDPGDLAKFLGSVGELAGTGFNDDDLVRFMAQAGNETRGNGDSDAAVGRPKKAKAKLGQLWILGDHRLLCGSSASANDVARLMQGKKAVLCASDAPYGVDYVEVKGLKKTWKEGIENDNLSPEKLRELLDQVFTLAPLAPRAAIYQWHPDRTFLAEIFAQAMLARGWLIHRTIIWNKPNFTLTRSGMYHWSHESCQPPGTMVRVPAENKRGGFKQVPIESLSTGDGVLAYDCYSKAIRGKRAGVPVKVGTRRYTGEMYSVTVGAKTTRATDGHLWSVRLAPAAAATWAVYLMRRENWWRVGISKVLAPYGCGVKSRAKGEHADATWILSTHGSQLEAICAEQVASVKYGIPTTHWRTTKHHGPSTRTADHIRRIYGCLDLAVVRNGALRALADHGRLEQYPLFEPASYGDKVSRRVSMIVRSCNLIRGVMAIPVPHATGDDATWTPIHTVARAAYSGPVYSLDVEKFHHYVADGIVTHNCFYGWQEGKVPPWFGEKNQRSVWDIALDEGKTVHPTQKPVEIFERPMLNHTAPGQVCYEPFAGSGSQIIAGEKLGRRVFAMELDPRWIDAIIERWQTFSGGRAKRA